MSATETKPVRDEYTLGRNYLASARLLVLQHYLWKDTFGFILHPTIIESLKSPHKVANGDKDLTLRIGDVGTGTGTWLFDVARSPDFASNKLELHGFDISDEQFPLPQWTPSNARFSTADAFIDPPQEVQGKFDVVHVKLFIAVLPKLGDPAPVLAHLYKLLRPGGVDSARHYGVTKANPGGPSPYHDELSSF